MLRMPSFPSLSEVPPRADQEMLTRIAGLAARLVDVPTAMVLAGPGLVPQATAGPLAAQEEELRRIVDALHPTLATGNTEWIEDLHVDPRFRGFKTMLRSVGAVPARSGDGLIRCVLLVASPRPEVRNSSRVQHLRDLAALASNELELRQRRSRITEPRRAQDQLLEKSLELAKFGEDLRQLHRLSTTNYETLEALFADYLETGCSILGLGCGTVIQVRGRYAVLRAVRSDSQSLRAGMTFDLTQAFCGVVSEDRRTVAVASVSEDSRLAPRPHYGAVRQSCYLGAPLLVDGEVYGVLSFSSPHVRWTEFSSHETELIELMAKSIGRCILEGRMQEGRERAEALEQDRSQVLEMVAKDQPLRMVLDKVVAMVERQSPALSATIHEVRDGRLTCLSAPSMPEAYWRRAQRIPLPQKGGCCFSAAYTRQTEIFDAHAMRCQASEQDCTHEFCWQACGASPILSGSGELLGVVCVYWRLAVRPFVVDPELLGMASHLAALAIEHRNLTDRLAYQAHHDSLTGLANRALLTRVLDEKLARPESLAVAFVDLDRFKQINDHLGHKAGDLVLRTVAQRIGRLLGAGELAARLGGDEFVAVLTGFTSEEEAYARSQRILEAVREPITFEGRTIHTTASVGLSFSVEGGSAETLLGSADLAMYSVKNNGRNDVLCSTPDLEDGHMTRLELEHSLRRALDENEFRLYFQPIFEIQGGVALVGFEALLGWQHPTLGRISPLQFIPIAEECGMIAPIGAWVLERACSQMAEWQRAGLPEVRISVNVSALQFARPEFVTTVAQVLAVSGLEPEWLQLELTESAIMEDVSTAMPKLDRLRDLGVRLALDDFGTGYSSLGYLRWLPVECLKIDRSFLREMEHSQGALTIVQMILALAHNMGLTVVAEGVETEQQYEMLRDANCDMVQGHLFGSALAQEDVEQWLMREAAIPA